MEDLWLESDHLTKILKLPRQTSECSVVQPADWPCPMSMVMWRVWTILLLCRIFLMFASNFQFRSCQLFCGEIFLYAVSGYLLVSKDLFAMVKFIDFCLHNHPHIKTCCSQPSVGLILREREAAV